MLDKLLILDFIPETDPWLPSVDSEMMAYGSSKCRVIVVAVVDDGLSHPPAASSSVSQIDFPACM